MLNFPTEHGLKLAQLGGETIELATLQSSLLHACLIPTAAELGMT